MVKFRRGNGVVKISCGGGVVKVRGHGLGRASMQSSVWNTLWES